MCARGGQQRDAEKAKQLPLSASHCSDLQGRSAPRILSGGMTVAAAGTAVGLHIRHLPDRLQRQYLLAARAWQHSRPPDLNRAVRFRNVGMGQDRPVPMSGNGGCGPGTIRQISTTSKPARNGTPHDYAGCEFVFPLR